MTTNTTTAIAKPSIWDNYEGPTGMESVKQSDLGMPYLNVIQKGSAEFDEAHKDHALKRIEGVKVGSIINTAARNILYSPRGPGLVVVPCKYLVTWVEWKPKQQGGGIVRTHYSSLSRRTKTNDKGVELIVEGEGAGNEVKETSSFFLLYLDNPDAAIGTQSILNLTSSGLGVGRNWLNRIRGYRSAKTGNCLPMWAHLWTLGTIPRSNDRGSWAQVDAGHLGENMSTSLIEQARAFCEEATEYHSRLSTEVVAETVSQVSDGENL